MNNKKLLEVKDLKVHFHVNDFYTVYAVNGISFDIEMGEILGLVGESGSGKSTLAKTIGGIYKPTGGKILYDGIQVSGKNASKEGRKRMQREVQMVFQDSGTSLNPRMSVEKILLEPLRIQRLLEGREKDREKIKDMLALVGMDEDCLVKFPGELSGGERQRIAVARSMMLYPKLLIADEPVASLDVSIQAQVINLLKHLRDVHHFSILFIAHDLSVVRFLSDRVAVMLKGKIVEIVSTTELFLNPIHPYARSLISAMHVPDPVYERNKKLIDFDRSLPLGEKMTDRGQGHLVLSF